MKQGCRTGEARVLPWEDVDWSAHHVWIRGGFDLGQYKPFTKERDVRYVPLHPEVEAALRRLPRALSGFIFITSKGEPISQRHTITIWRNAVKAAGIDVTCYGGTHHSFASQAIISGCDERTIGEFMGHKTPAMTKRYAKLRTEALKRVWGPQKELSRENEDRDSFGTVEIGGSEQRTR